MLPKYPNLILIGSDGRIVSALHYKDDVERPVVSGAPWVPPPQPRDKPSIWDPALDETRLRVFWEEAGRPAPGIFFRDHVRGTDPEWVRHLSGLGDDALPTALADRDRATRDEWGPFGVEPTVPPRLRLFPDSTQETEPFAKDLHRAMEGLHVAWRDHRVLHLARRRMEEAIQRALKREQRIRLKLKDDRARAEGSDRFQWWGELLMAQLHQIPPHTAEVELEDVIRGGISRVTISLDPALPVLDNARRYFHKAQKGTRGLALIEKREREIEDRIHALQSARRSLPAISRLEEIQKAFAELFPGAETVRQKHPESAKRVEKVPTPNIHREKIAPGVELCAGASASANEIVTFQMAQPDDLWFHARDYPGAHVVLRRLNRNGVFTDEIVMKAALYAASHCKAKKDAKVTVSYTERKYVRRIPGAPTGMVTMTRERSLVLNPTAQGTP
jgi:predicted ribosome quality control (RQC) complex YloA/Tae2 family protein